MSIRIQHVSIPFPPGGQAAARAFYGDVLRLQEVPMPSTLNAARLVWYRVGDTELHLFQEAPVDDPSGRHFCFALENRAALDALRGWLVAAGVTVEEVIAIPGRPRFVCRDPFRNLLEFTTLEDDYLYPAADADAVPR